MFKSGESSTYYQLSYRYVIGGVKAKTLCVTVLWHFLSITCTKASLYDQTDVLAWHFRLAWKIDHLQISGQKKKMSMENNGPFCYGWMGLSLFTSFIFSFSLLAFLSLLRKQETEKGRCTTAFFFQTDIFMLYSSNYEWIQFRLIFGVRTTKV